MLRKTVSCFKLFPRKAFLTLALCTILVVLELSAQRSTNRTFTREDGLELTEVHKVILTHKGDIIVQQNNLKLYTFDGYSFEEMDTSTSIIDNRLSEVLIDSARTILMQWNFQKVLVIENDRTYGLDLSTEAQDFYLHSLRNDTLHLINKKTQKQLLINLDTKEIYPKERQNLLGLNDFRQDRIKINGSNDHKYTVVTDGFLSNFYINGKLNSAVKGNNIFRLFKDGVIANQEDLSFYNNDQWNKISKKDFGTYENSHTYRDHIIITKELDYEIYDLNPLNLSLELDYIVPRQNTFTPQFGSSQMYVGSHAGLHRFSKNIVFFKSGEKGMPPALHVINEDRDGNIWFGSYGQGLSYWNGKKFIKPQYDAKNRNLLPGTTKDRMGNLYFLKEGIQKGALIKVVGDKFEFNYPSRTDTDYVTGFFLDTIHDGRMIIGSAKAGLAVEKNIGNLDFDFIGKEKGLLLENVLTAVEDGNKNIWCGRSGQGLAVVDMKNDTAITWLKDKSDGGFSFGVGSTDIDKHGTLWMGGDTGIRYIENITSVDIYKDNVFESSQFLSLPNGDNSRVSFLEEIEGYIVFGNLTSVNFLSLKEFYQNPNNPRIYQLIYGEDIEGGGSEQNCILFDSRRRLWFGSQEGASYIKWDDFTFDTTLNEVKLKSILSGGSKITVANNTIVLPKDNRNCEIRFGPKNNPSLLKNIFFDYFLLNRDGDTLSSFLYDQQGLFKREYFEPGNYTLHIHAKKHGQLMHTLSTDIQVPKTLAERPIFWAFSVFFVLGSLIGFLFFRNRQQKSELLLLNLKNDKEYLKVQSIISSFNPHFINNSLHWAQSRHRKDEVFVDMIDRLSENIQYIFTNSQNSKAFHSLENELRLVENYVEIQKVRFRNNFNYYIPSQALLQKYGNVNIIIMQLQIHVENAIEHGINNREEASYVKIGINEFAKGIEIFIEDDGCGRTYAKQIKSRGTQMGTRMLSELHAIFNTKNKLKMTQTYDDHIFKDKNNIPYGTRVRIFIPFDYKTEL